MMPSVVVSDNPPPKTTFTLSLQTATSLIRSFAGMAPDVVFSGKTYQVCPPSSVYHGSPFAPPTSQCDGLIMATAVSATPTAGPVTACQVSPPLSVKTTALLLPTATTFWLSMASTSFRVCVVTTPAFCTITAAVGSSAK